MTWKFNPDKGHLTGKIFLLGLAGVVLFNYRLWRRDMAFLDKMADTPAPPPLDTWPQLPKVSVIVAAWNEEQNIEPHIQSFLALRYTHKELILCAGGSDRTYALATRWAGDAVIVLQQRPGEGKQRALRRCLEPARGSVIFLTDADCLLDDDSFERTVFPVASGSEKACTGSSQPYADMMLNPFVLAQSAPNLYSAFHRPSYASGLLGRNCALERRLLESSQGLDAPAPTGTDYVLAKMISRTGVQIWQIPESRIATEYPTTARGYLRQRRRWLRNVALHGWRFGAKDEVRKSLFTSAVGLGMLLLPFSALVLGSTGIAIWLILFVQALLSRLRYLHFASNVIGFPLSWNLAVAQFSALLLDFVAWSRPLLDYVFKDSDREW